jgi:hypothetical protein
LPSAAATAAVAALATVPVKLLSFAASVQVFMRSGLQLACPRVRKRKKLMEMRSGKATACAMKGGLPLESAAADAVALGCAGNRLCGDYEEFGSCRPIAMPRTLGGLHVRQPALHHAPVAWHLDSAPLYLFTPRSAE